MHKNAVLIHEDEVPNWEHYGAFLMREEQAPKDPHTKARVSHRKSCSKAIIYTKSFRFQNASAACSRKMKFF